MTRQTIIPPGSWPRRMGVAMAAGYCGESSVEAFEKRIGTEYPASQVNDGRRRLWLRDDLDLAMGIRSGEADVQDAAEVL